MEISWQIVVSYAKDAQQRRLAKLLIFFQISDFHQWNIMETTLHVCMASTIFFALLAELMIISAFQQMASNTSDLPWTFWKKTFHTNW